MSKAEDLALEKYPQRSVLFVPARGGGYYADSHLREGFIEGYHQAEKDLELTWEDFALIRLVFDAIEANIHRGAMKIQPMTKEYYQEVLKRFKDLKEEKDK